MDMLGLGGQGIYMVWQWGDSSNICFL